MKTHHRNIFAILTVVFTTSNPVSAATNFTTVGGLVTVAGNWDNGLPTGANQGTININASVATATNLDNYNILHTGGSINQASGTTAVQLINGASWETDGAGATTNSGNFRGFDLKSGSSFTLRNGTINTISGRDWLVQDTGSTMTVGGGTINLGRHLLLSGTSTTAGSEFTITGGTINGTTSSGELGGRSFSGNKKTFNFNGGSTTTTKLDLAGANTFFVFGGTNAGSLTASSMVGAFGTNSSYNWLSGTQMTLTLTGVTDFAETYWNANRLLFNGSSRTALGGLSWADATNSAIGLGGGYYWDFDGTGNTLALAVIPEPAGISLLGLALGAAVLIRRRPRE